MELKVGILNLKVHNQLRRKYGVNIIMTRKELEGILGWEFKLERGIRVLVINEMIKQKLIEKVDRDNIKILRYDVDIETIAGRNKLCKEAGIF